MTDSTILRGMTWDHSRGFVSMVATTQRFHELHPTLDIHWSKRSLQEFADSPLDNLAEQFDLLVIDHPWAGFAAANGILLPLEKHLPEDFILDQANNSVGLSHKSYQFNGSQWALAIDAACPVSARRPDLLEKAGFDAPDTFDDLIELGKRGLVCCPSIPLDVYGNFLNLCTAAGETIFPNEEVVVDYEAGIIALERLKQLAEVVPDKFFELNPIRTLEIMSQTDEFAYAPYTYGYTNYSRQGYAPNLVTFGDVIGEDKGAPGSTMLGGTGLAISAKCEHPEIAAQFAQYVGSSAMQRGLFFESGGQPGHRSAWLDTSTNKTCADFFTNTLATLDRAFIRPRYPHYLEFQDSVGYPVHDFLKYGGSSKNLMNKINDLYRQSRLAA